MAKFLQANLGRGKEANDPRQGPTFESANGRSWVDITWSREIELAEWTVQDTETLSDHKYVTFSVKGCLAERKGVEWVYDFHGTDWEGFRGFLLEYE